MSSFLSGQCHALAYAMHVKFGYPIYAVADEDNYVDHFVVRRADGSLYDFAGWADADSFFDRPEMEWAQEFYVVNVGEFFEIVRDNAWEPMKMNEAFEIAELLGSEL